MKDVAELRAEIERLQAGIRAHRDASGDDRCWLDDLALYDLLDPLKKSAQDLVLPPRGEFLANCERFWKSRQPHGCPYVTEAERQKVAVDAERAACCAAVCGYCHNAAHGGEIGFAVLAEGGGLYVHARPVTGSDLKEWIPCRADAIRRAKR